MSIQKRCPDCGNDLKPIVYGLLTNKSDDNLVGGCDVDGLEPHFGCDKCGWRGFPGGRLFKTIHTKPRYKTDVQTSDNPEIIHVVFDVARATEEQLWVWSAGLFEARLELLHRGIPKELIEAREQEEEYWTSMPFEAKELLIAYFDSTTSRVLGISYFYAMQNVHVHRFLESGMQTWDSFYSRTEFHDHLANYKVAGLESWSVDFDPDSEDIENIIYSEAGTLGSAVVQSLSGNWLIEKTLLERNGDQFAHSILWPSWFEPSECFDGR